MKTYDFKSVKKYIQMHSDVIEEVSLGMQEDWFWTGQTVYEDSKFVIDLDEEDLKIGGIHSSAWATPYMCVVFKDTEGELFKPAYTGESDSQRPEWFTLGCLSGPVQDKIDASMIPKIGKDN